MNFFLPWGPRIYTSFCFEALEIWKWVHTNQFQVKSIKIGTRWKILTLQYRSMAIVICQPRIRAIFSVDGWSILWSCARVAGSGRVRACSGETRNLAMVSWYYFYTNHQWVNSTSPFDLWHAPKRHDTGWWHLSLRVTFHLSVWHSMTRWLLLLFKYYFFWMKMLTVSLLCALVFAYNVRVTEGQRVHPSPSGCNVYASVYVSSCLLSAE